MRMVVAVLTVRVIVRMGDRRRPAAVELQHEARSMEGASPDPFHPRGPPRHPEAPHRIEHLPEVGTRVDQGGHQHVPGDPADGVDPRALHGVPRPRFTRDAAYAAPKPLSMFTTVTPGAQLLSIASSAATPPKEAP